MVKYACLLVTSLFCLFPIFWTLMTSIKPQSQWVSVPIVWIPSSPTVFNYVYLLSSFGGAYFTTLSSNAPVQLGFSPEALKPFADSLFLSTVSAVAAIILGIFAAYSMSRYKTGGASMPFFVLMFRMFPPVAVIVPIVIMYSTFRLVDTYFGLIIAYTGFTLPFAVWFIKGFFDAVPREIDEAARVDGCKSSQVLFKAVLPLIKGGVAVTALFLFILNWSDFQIALLLTSGSIITIPVSLSERTALYGQLYGPMAAMGMIALVPVLIFGILIQKYLVRGFTLGAFKGT
jgi:multiple sugar transport system permease protein